ncbi:MAG: hypothetical protein ACYCQI_17085 [Gammaproteobacteria bacterium]
MFSFQDVMQARKQGNSILINGILLRQSEFELVMTLPDQRSLVKYLKGEKLEQYKNKLKYLLPSQTVDFALSPYRISGGLQGYAAPLGSPSPPLKYPADLKPITSWIDLASIIKGHPFYFIDLGFDGMVSINTGTQRILLEFDRGSHSFRVGKKRYQNLEEFCNSPDSGLRLHQRVEIRDEKYIPEKSYAGYVDYSDNLCNGIPFEMQPYQYCICRGYYAGWLELVCTFADNKQFAFDVIPLADGRYLIDTDWGIVFPSLHAIVALLSEKSSHRLQPFAVKPEIKLEEKDEKTIFSPPITPAEFEILMQSLEQARQSGQPPANAMQRDEKAPLPSQLTTPPGGPSFYSAAEPQEAIGSRESKKAPIKEEKEREDSSVKLMKLAFIMPQSYLNAPRGFHLFRKTPHKEEVQQLVERLAQCQADKSNSKFENQLQCLLAAYKNETAKLGDKFRDKLNDHPNTHHYARILAVFLQTMSHDFSDKINKGLTVEINSLVAGVNPQPYFAGELKATKVVEGKR